VWDDLWSTNQSWLVFNSSDGCNWLSARTAMHAARREQRAARALPLDQPHAFQFQDHLMRAVVDIDILGIDHQFGFGRGLIGV
jgi:hypothetical protein